MTPQALIAAFDVIAEAPSGARQLRGLVLDLATRGKLVAQDSADEPASALLLRIANEQRRMHAKGSAQPAGQFVTDTARYVDIEIPDNWIVVQFGAVFLDLFTGPFGTSLKKSDYVGGGIPVVNPQNLQDGRIVPVLATAVAEGTLTRLKVFSLRSADVVVARRGEMGRCAVVGSAEAGWLCGTGSLVLRPPSILCSEYVAVFLRSPSTVARLGGESVGSTMMNLNQRILSGLPFPLPPLAEQHRIVARVDELMSLIDRLEAARTKREATRAAARDAALAALRDADDAAAVQRAWARIATHMDVLFTHPNDVEPLRQTILQLAVRGRLVPQDPNDEPASELLKRIATEKARLVKEGKIRKSDPLPPVSPEEVPFAVPAGWVWTRLGTVCKSVADGDHQAPPRAEQGIAFLTIGNVSRGYLDFRDTRHVPETYFAGLDSSRRPMFDDVLYTVVGSYGRALVVDSHEPFCVQRHIAILRAAPEMSNLFLRDFLNSPLAYRQATAAKTGSAQPTVALGPLRRFLFPCPPLAEQRRIVVRLAELIESCNRLTTALSRASTVQAMAASSATGARMI